MKQEFISTIFKTQKHNGNTNYNTNGEAAAMFPMEKLP